MEYKTVEATKRNEAKASFEALIGQFGPMLVDRGLTPPSLDDKDDTAAITMKARELGGHVVAMQVALSPTPELDQVTELGSKDPIGNHQSSGEGGTV